MKKQQVLSGLIVVLLVCGFAPFVFGQAEGAGTLTIVNQYGGGVYYLTIERGSGGGPGPVRVSSRAQPVKRRGEGNTIERGSGGGPVPVRVASRGGGRSRLEEGNRPEEGKMYGTTVLIADGGSKSYSLEAGSYYVTLNFYKPGRGVYTMTEPPIVITAGQTRTLTITADGKLNY